MVDRRLAAPILALLIVLVAVPASAYTWGTVYITGPTSVEATITAKIVDSQAVSVNANSTYKFNVTPPKGWDTPGVIEAVIVKVSSTASGAKLVALDANNTQIATADVVPLSSGEFSVTFPGNTASVEIQNLGTSIWQGTVTILVQSTIKFNFTFPDQITVQNGQGQGIVFARQVSGPAGKIFILDSSTKFDVKFKDPTPEYSGDYMVETTGAGWSDNIPLVVTASNVSPGSYSVSFKVYFQDQNGLKAELATYRMSITLNSQGQGQATVQSSGNGDNKWKYAGIGVVAGLILAMLFLGGGGGRRGMAPAWLILLVMLAVIAFAAGLLDIHVNTHIDPVWLGVGIIALLALFMMSRQGLVKIRR